MAGILKCACGFTMELECREDAPPFCPGCGGGRLPDDGMTKKEARATKAAFARAKLAQGKVLGNAFDGLAADMDALREQMDPEPAA